VPTVNEAKEFRRKALIVLAKDLKKAMEVIKVPTVHKTVGAEEALSKIVGGYSFPSSTIAPILMSHRQEDRGKAAITAAAHWRWSNHVNDL